MSWVMTLAQTIPRNALLLHTPAWYSRHAKLRGLSSILCSKIWVSEFAFSSLNKSRVTPYG